MEIITIESGAYQALIDKIVQIEKYVKGTTDLFADFEKQLELSSKDLQTVLGVSKSTLYRWRKDRVIPFRYDDSGNALYSFKGLVLAVKNGNLKIRGLTKTQMLMQLATLKEQIIQNSLWENKHKE